ncbi:MAG: hypothetical protein ACYDA9_10625 [Terriglobia bacterium]
MVEKKVKLPFPTPTSPPKDGFEVGVSESTEKWTEVTLTDGTSIRLKASILSAIRIEGEYDPKGNPAYAIQIQSMITVVDSPEHLKKPTKDSKIQ